MQNKLIASHLMTKISLFLESSEFNEVFDLEMDFFISHSILSMHIWLICQRLQNFKVKLYKLYIIYYIILLEK